MTAKSTIDELIEQWHNYVVAVKESIESREKKEFKFQMRNCQRAFVKLKSKILEEPEENREQIKERVKNVLSILESVLESLPTWMDETKEEIAKEKSKKKVKKRIGNSYNFFKKRGNNLDFRAK
jgi:uncharacterized damage-inducible protein DinB